jgi:hypothetical protein
VLTSEVGMVDKVGVIEHLGNSDHNIIVWKLLCDASIGKSKFVPVGKAQSKKYPRWMNKAAKAARNQKSKMWIKYRNSRQYKDLVEYKKVQNKAVKEYRKAKRNFERKLAKDIKVNPKSFYAYVRSKTKVRDAVGPLVNSAGIKESDHEEMCNILNDFK